MKKGEMSTADSASSSSATAGPNDQLPDNGAAPDQTADADPDAPTQVVMGYPLAALFAVGGAITVANLYLAQPILETIKNDYGITQAQVGTLVSLEQGGYAAGLLFLTPLGDLLPRKQLILVLTLVTALFNVVKGLSVNFTMLQAFSFLLGLATVTPQILMPFAADIAPPAKRGLMMGLVLSGMKIGSLLGRLISGIVTEHFGWRVIFVGQGILNFALVVIFFFLMPPWV